MKTSIFALCLAIALSVTNVLLAEARMSEPSTVPQQLKGMEPHNPRVSKYYFQEMVKQGLMTKREAEASQLYMIFRHFRRKGDLWAVKDMDIKERRAYMKGLREKRDNPVKEYADFCSLTLERSEELMNILHDSQKGTKYYKKINN